jgi:hypothetical protein
MLCDADDDSGTRTYNPPVNSRFLPCWSSCSFNDLDGALRRFAVLSAINGSNYGELTINKYRSRETKLRYSMVVLLASVRPGNDHACSCPWIMVFCDHSSSFSHST